MRKVLQPCDDAHRPYFPGRFLRVDTMAFYRSARDDGHPTIHLKIYLCFRNKSINSIMKNKLALPSQSSKNKSEEQKSIPKKSKIETYYKLSLLPFLTICFSFLHWCIESLSPRTHSFTRSLALSFFPSLPFLPSLSFPFLSTLFPLHSNYISYFLFPFAPSLTHKNVNNSYKQIA